MPSVGAPLLFLTSLVLCAFGQPAWNLWCSIAAGAGAYALLWRITSQMRERKYRFLLGSLWFFIVQLVQLSWLISHPYLYIYIVYLVFSAVLAIQFGLLSALLTEERVKKISTVFGAAGLWVLMEWSRHFFLSGFSWNPVGLALTATLYPLQLASLGGVFGLSFWVILSSLLLLRYLLRPTAKGGLCWMMTALLPYGSGAMLLQMHEGVTIEKPWKTLALQTFFPPEEAMEFGDMKGLIHYVMWEWEQILKLSSPYRNQPLDLVLLPEFTVPFAAYGALYPYEEAKMLFLNSFGKEVLALLPLPEPPFGDRVALQNDQKELLVNNAFFVQGLANCLNSSIVIGLEDGECDERGTLFSYSALLHFIPQGRWQPNRWPPSERYAKRVLLPLAEYIPFDWCRSLAASYGIGGSFTPGCAPSTFNCGNLKISPSICYEETFGSLISEGKEHGVQLFANATNDGWYPSSLLPRQHLDHARLRAVENGVPLLRACNTGITTAIDSVGRTIAELDEYGPAALYAEIPHHTYETWYTFWGDLPILIFSFLCALFLFCF